MRFQPSYECPFWYMFDFQQKELERSRSDTAIPFEIRREQMKDHLKQCISYVKKLPLAKKRLKST